MEKRNELNKVPKFNYKSYITELDSTKNDLLVYIKQQLQIYDNKDYKKLIIFTDLFWILDETKTPIEILTHSLGLVKKYIQNKTLRKIYDYFNIENDNSKFLFGTHNNIVPNKNLENKDVVFESKLLKDDTTKVYVCGDFNNWQKEEMTYYAETESYKLIKKLTKGKYEYKFYINDEYVLDPSIETKINNNGYENHIIVIE